MEADGNDEDGPNEFIYRRFGIALHLLILHGIDWKGGEITSAALPISEWKTKKEVKQAFRKIKIGRKAVDEAFHTFKDTMIEQNKRRSLRISGLSSDVNRNDSSIQDVESLSQGDEAEDNFPMAATTSQASQASPMIVSRPDTRADAIHSGTGEQIFPNEVGMLYLSRSRYAPSTLPCSSRLKDKAKAYFDSPDSFWKWDEAFPHGIKIGSTTKQQSNERRTQSYHHVYAPVTVVECVIRAWKEWGESKTREPWNMDRILRQLEKEAKYIVSPIILLMDFILIDCCCCFRLGMHVMRLLYSIPVSMKFINLTTSSKMAIK